MNHMKIYGQLLVICISIVLSACNSGQEPVIKGTIKPDPEWKPMIYLIQPNHFSEIAADYQGQVVDSSDIAANGTFVFHELPFNTEKSLFILTIQKNDSKYPNHLYDEIPLRANYIPVILSRGESITCSAESNAFQESFSIPSLTDENKAIMDLRDLRLAAFRKYLKTQNQLSENDTLLLEKEKAQQMYMKTLMDFADTTKILEAAMIAIRWASPAGDYERIPEFITRQCKKWQTTQPDHPFVKELCDVANREDLPIQIGDVIPNHPLPLLNGDTATCTELLGEKLTLLDIWASWCAPCRKENKTVLAPLWSEYKDNGFQIIGYSIDGDESAWRTAVEKDGAQWIQSSHLTGDATPFMDALRITTIPANFILDANGKVVGKNLHGEELREYVEGYLE